MNDTTFLTVAALAEEAIGSPAVADRWGQPSALEGYTVGGLAGHLARAVLTVTDYLDRPPPATAGEPTDAAGYFVRVLASHDPVSSELHRRVRQRGEQEAVDGPQALVTRLRDARRDLTERFGDTQPGRRIAVFDDTVMALEHYLETRLVELVVHLDDLAISIDQEGPGDLPPDAYEVVAAVLVRVAARRLGPLATVRSLARRERHPDAIRAL